MATGRHFALGDHRWIAGLLLTIAIGLWSVPGSAFELDGHEVIEATAYKRLLALHAVPGTGPPEISGRALLAALIATGVLAEPPCFDRGNPRGDCGAAQRLDLPLRYWPTLRSGGPDIVIDRQLGQRGQCQHFMASTADGLTPVDPRFGVPGGLATTAYLRCIREVGLVFDGILRDPRLAEWRVVGPYVLMHAIEDSFSAAHVDRDPHFKIVHLLSWTLIDWPTYLLHGKGSFPAPTHHAASDHRDFDYVRWDARTSDGHVCREFHHPYAFPEECLTDRAKAAVDAVVDYLVLTLSVARPRERGGAASLAVLTGAEQRRRALDGFRARAPAERGGGPGAASGTAQRSATSGPVRRRAGSRRLAHVGGRALGREDLRWTCGAVRARAHRRRRLQPQGWRRPARRVRAG